MRAETRGDAVEFGVVVAGMAAELVGAGGWERVQKLGESGRSEIARGGDGDGAFCGDDVAGVVLKDRREAGAKAAYGAYAEAAEVAAVIEREAEVRLEGIADSADGSLLRNIEQRAEDGGEQMRVLVRVQVGDGDACTLQLCDLREGLAGDVGWVDATEEERAEESRQAGTERLLVRADEGRDGRGCRDWDAVGKDDVAADSEGWMGVGDGDGVVERGAIGHERGGGEAAGGVEFCDGAIDARG